MIKVKKSLKGVIGLRLTKNRAVIRKSCLGAKIFELSEFIKGNHNVHLTIKNMTRAARML